MLRSMPWDFSYPPEVLLLPSCQGFALHPFLGYSEKSVLVVGLPLGFGKTFRSSSSGPLLLQQHFLKKGGSGAVVVYAVWRNAQLCEIYSGGTVKQHGCFCMILSKINYS